MDSVLSLHRLDRGGKSILVNVGLVIEDVWGMLERRCLEMVKLGGVE